MCSSRYARGSGRRAPCAPPASDRGRRRSRPAHRPAARSGDPSDGGRCRGQGCRLRRTIPAGCAKARGLFVGEIDDGQRDRRRGTRPAAQRFKTSEHAERAVEPAAVRHRIEVAADDDRLRPRPRQRDPSVAGGIFLGAQARSGQTLVEQARRCAESVPTPRAGRPERRWFAPPGRAGRRSRHVRSPHPPRCLASVSVCLLGDVNIPPARAPPARPSAGEWREGSTGGPRRALRARGARETLPRLDVNIGPGFHQGAAIMEHGHIESAIVPQWRGQVRRGCADRRPHLRDRGGPAIPGPSRRRR